jgi:uncharacterized RDD family membrane protein YckC
MGGTTLSEARDQHPPYPKADLTLRALARLVDFLVAFALAWYAPPVGPVAAALYMLVADALMNGQSLGKRLFGVRAMSLTRRAPAGLVDSVLRNSPFALVAVFGAAPQLWLALFVAGVPMIAVEAYRVVTHPQGLRVGDLMAETQVVDGKVLAKPEAVGQSLATPAPVRPSSSASAGRA